MVVTDITARKGETLHRFYSWEEFANFKESLTMYDVEVRRADGIVVVQAKVMYGFVRLISGVLEALTGALTARELSEHMQGLVMLSYVWTSEMQKEPKERWKLALLNSEQ